MDSSFPQCSVATRTILNAAIALSQSRGERATGAPHILLALLDARVEPENEILNALLAFSGVKTDEARFYFEALCENNALVGNGLWDESGFQLLKGAADEARRDMRSLIYSIKPEHLLLGALHSPKKSGVAAVANGLGLELHVLRAKLRGLKPEKRRYSKFHPLSRLDSEAKIAIERAHILARNTGSGYVGSGHILLALLENPALVETLERADFALDELKSAAREQLTGDGQLWTPTPQFSLAAKNVLDRANTQAQDEKPTSTKIQICPRHLLVGCVLPDHATTPSLASGDALDDAAGAVLSRFEPRKLRILFDPLADSRGFRELSNTAVRYDAIGTTVGLFWWPLVIGMFSNWPQKLLPVPDLGQWFTLIFGGASVGVILASLVASAQGNRVWKDRFASIIAGWLVCGALAIVGSIALMALS